MSAVIRADEPTHRGFGGPAATAIATKSLAARDVHQELADSYAGRARAAEADAVIKRRCRETVSNLTMGET